jgi:hypothetical protein
VNNEQPQEQPEQAQQPRPMQLIVMQVCRQAMNYVCMAAAESDNQETRLMFLDAALGAQLRWVHDEQHKHLCPVQVSEGLVALYLTLKAMRGERANKLAAHQVYAPAGHELN